MLSNQKKEQDLVQELKNLLKETEVPVLDKAVIKKMVAEELSVMLTKESSVVNKNSYQDLRLETSPLKVVQSTEATTIPFFLKIIDDLRVGNNVFLYGEAGTGKTTLAEKVAETLRVDFITINCNQWTSPLSIIGGQTMEGYEEGSLIKAWKEGKMLILDEMPKLDSNTAGLLNDALAKTDKPEGTILFNGRGDAIKKHKNFCVIATGNTTGKGTSQRYNGNNKQDLSLLDRFSGSFYEVGFNRELEKSLLHAKVFEICDKIRSEIFRVNADEIMTLRTMLQLNKIYQLEMKRELGMLPKVSGGKTLLDGLNSYFFIMNKDKAELIKINVNMDLFKNSYKDRAIFSKEIEGIKELKKVA